MKRTAFRPGRRLAFAAAALVVAAAALPASAAELRETVGSTSTRAGEAHSQQSIRTRKPPKVSPRELRPEHKAGTGRKRSENDVRGEVPRTSGSGKPTKGLPPVAGDTGRTASGPKARTSAPALANGNFANLLAFTGATLASPNCGCQPPDTQLAVGRNEVVEAVNNDILVYSRGGTQLASFPASDLFQPPNQSVGLTDPKILFDPTAGSNGLYYVTFMVCEGGGCGGSAWSHMGISLAVTDNPLGNWWVYDYLNDGNELQDQPKLGFSADKITFAVNQYGCKCGSGAQYRQENVAVLQKSDVVAAATVDYVVASFQWNTTGNREFDWMPTTPVNASTADATQYVVWNEERTSSNELGLMRITGTPDAANVSFASITKIGIANNTAPPAGVQPGGTVAGDKMNFQSAMVQGNQLWATGTDGCTPQNDNTTRACTRLVEIALGSNSVLQDFDVGTQGTYRYNPSVMKDSTDHLYFGFTISSATDYPTAALDASALPPPAVFGRINFATGDATYTGSRWGDYSGTQQDPVNTNDVWSAQEFGACATACSSGGGNWATAIGQFTFRDPHVTSISPNHGPATGGTSVDIHGSEFANGGTTVKFGSANASSVTFVDSTHIQAVSPPGDSGTVHVTAMTGTGTSDTSSSDEFTYNPVLTSVVPNNGPDTGGQSVTISGAGLNGATAVSFGGTPAASFTPVNSSTVTAVTPAHAGGTVNLTVTTSGGGTSNAISYTFQFTTTTALASSANPSIVGAAVTFTATVSPVPNGGTISFTDNASPVAGCQSLPVNTSTGQATCTVTYGSVGSHSIVATYSGNFFYLPSTSGALLQRVTYAIVVLYDQTREINSGANVPVKVALADAFGTNVSSAGIVLTVAGLSPSPAPGTPPSGPFSFQLLDSGPGYLLNVKTKDYPPGTYTLSFTATGDPVIHTVQFVLR
jgi:Bacterial Ig-like domain (group 3)/IPT/TIG domain